MAKIHDISVIDNEKMDYTWPPCRINYAVSGRPNAAEGPGICVTNEKVRGWLANVPAYWREKIAMYLGIRGLLVAQPYHADRAALQARLEALEDVFRQNNVPFSALAEHTIIVWEIHGIRRQIQLVVAEQAVEHLLATFKVARVAAPPAAKAKASEKPEVPEVPVLEL